VIHCSLVHQTRLLVSVWLALLNGCGFENGKQIVRQIPIKDMEDNSVIMEIMNFATFHGVAHQGGVKNILPKMPSSLHLL
jgi:hypothetical protein